MPTLNPSKPKKRLRQAIYDVRSSMPIDLNAKELLEIEARLVQEYSAQADNLLDEVEALLGAQTWPNDFLFEGRRPA